MKFKTVSYSVLCTDRLWTGVLWFCVAVMSLVFSGSMASAANPQWIINNTENPVALSVDQGNLSRVTGLTKIIASGSDLTVMVPFGSKDAFSADEHPFFAMRYKYKSSVRTAGLFFTTEKLTALSDKSYSPFGIIPDGTWRTVIVDMRKFGHGNWHGKVTSFRLDPTNPSVPGSEISLSRMGFFTDEAAAQAFLDLAKDEPDYSEDTVFQAPLQRVFVPAGCLFDGFKQEQFQLVSTEIDHPGITTVVEYTNNDGQKSIVPVCETNRCGYTRFTALVPGEYRLVKRDINITDIAGHAQEKAIRYVCARGLLSPDNEGKFHPQDPITEQQWKAVVTKLKQYGKNYEAIDVQPADRAAAAECLMSLNQQVLGTKIDSPFSPEYFTRDRIRIGAWVNLSERQLHDNFIKTYASGNFDWIIAHGRLASNEYRDQLFRDSDKYGVEVIFGDGGYYNPMEFSAEYYDHPSFAGHYVTDEPGTDSYPQLAEICNRYVVETKGKLPYINLLPMYANAAQLKYGAGAAEIEYYDPDPDLFKKYCDSFCQQFNVDYICTDIYPLNWAGDRRATYGNYLESINVIARSAREYNKDFWCCIQTFSWTKGKRTPTESEFRWQTYCMLSFGCKGILCWTYAAYNPEFPSLVDYDGNRTNSWYDARNVFSEIRSISDEFVKYKNIGAFNVNESSDYPYMLFSQQCKDFTVLKSIESDEPVLVGCFEGKEKSSEKSGKDFAFTLVNMSELEDCKTAHVSFKVNSSGNNDLSVNNSSANNTTAQPVVTTYFNGRPTVLQPDGEGNYRLELLTGAGVFVTVKQ